MAQKRIDFFGQFRPTGVDPTAAQKFRALAGVAEQVGTIATQMGIQKSQENIEAAGKEGALAGAEGRPEFREESTKADAAFNKAALLSYRASVRRDTKLEMERLNQEYELDPEGFKAAADGYFQGVTDDLPDEMRLVIGDDIQNSIVDNYSRLSDSAFKRQKQEDIANVAASLEDISDDISKAARSGNAQSLEVYVADAYGVIKQGVDSGLLSPDEANKRRELIKESIQTNQAIGDVERIFESEGTVQEKTRAATEYLESMDTSDLNQSQVDRLTDVLQGSIAENIKTQSQLTAEQEKEISRKTIELQLDAKYSRRAMTDILADAGNMFDANLLSESEYRSIKSDLISNAQKEAQTIDSDLAVMERLRGNKSIVMDASNVNSFYDRNVAPEVNELDPQAATATKVNFAIKTGVVPNAVTNEIKNGLLSNDPALIYQASDMLEQLDDAANIEVKLTANERAFADIVTNLTDTMQPEDAIQYARQLTDPTNQARVEHRSQIIKDDDLADNYQDIISSEFGGLFGGGLDDVNLPVMTEEYKQTFESLFKAGMDEDSAESKAVQLLKKNWSYSDAFDTVMKHAPDKFYSDTQGQSDYIKPQLMQWYSDLQFDGDIPKNILGNVNDLFLLSDDKTQRMGRSPDYLVMSVGDAGELMPLMIPDENGRLSAVRYAPDVKAQNDKIKEDPKQAYEDALNLGKERGRMAGEAVGRLDALSL